MEIKAKITDSDGGVVFTPDGDIPSGWKVRYIDGEFQAIPPDEEWPE